MGTEEYFHFFDIHHLMDDRDTTDEDARSKNIMILIFGRYVQVCKPTMELSAQADMVQSGCGDL
jgi:hypothetical protein